MVQPYDQEEWSEEDWSDEIPSSDDFYSDTENQDEEDILLPATLPPKSANWKWSQKNKSVAIDLFENVTKNGQKT